MDFSNATCTWPLFISEGERDSVCVTALASNNGNLFFQIFNTSLGWTDSDDDKGCNTYGAPSVIIQLANPSSHALSPRSFQLKHHRCREEKDQKSDGNDSKQLDVIISEDSSCGNAMRGADTGQTLLLRLRVGRKREEEKRARKGMAGAPLPGRQRAAFGSELQWQATSSLLSLSF